MFRSVTIAIATIACLPLTARADQFDTQVRAQMLGYAVGAAFHGYTLGERIQIGSLRQGTSTTFTLEVAAGLEYVLAAACDVDCSDVDLSLSELDGREIAADRGYDDLAVVAVPTNHPGTHRVTVSMPSCSTNPCRFGLGLFTRPRR
jgi:hypothetical protein